MVLADWDPRAGNNAKIYSGPDPSPVEGNSLLEAGPETVLFLESTSSVDWDAAKIVSEVYYKEQGGSAGQIRFFFDYLRDGGYGSGDSHYTVTVRPTRYNIISPDKNGTTPIDNVNIPYGQWSTVEVDFFETNGKVRVETHVNGNLLGGQRLTAPAGENGRPRGIALGCTFNTGYFDNTKIYYE